MPDYGICIIGSILAEKGFDVEIFIEHVEPPHWDSLAAADLVLMSTFSASARRTYELADRIRAELQVPIVMGGTHATYFTAECLGHCDVVVLREGDETVVELIGALATGAPLSEVAGIAYRENGRIRRTRERPGPTVFDTIQNYRLIRGFKRFRWHDILRRRRVPLVTAQSSRGCPFHCRFCIVDTMFGGGYRTRDIENLLEDLKDKRRYGRELLFVDNYFGADATYTKRLLGRIIEETLDFDIIVLCRIEIAQDPEMMTLMQRAGVTALYVGIESIQPETLKKYAKHQNLGRIRASVAVFHRHGFRLSGSFVIGADTDTSATIDATVSFALENGIEVCYFFPLWGHYLEKKLGNRPLIPRHRSIFKGWDYCDGNFVTHFPLQMRPSQLQQAVIDAHRRVYAPAAFWEAARKKDWTAVKEKAANRYAWGFIEKGLVQYIPWLQEIEAGFYDENDRLLEDRLLRHPEKCRTWTFPDAVLPEKENIGDPQADGGPVQPEGFAFRCNI
jgi:radical SAM superfamily enzyme YgiQ (UPF0313 family)